MRQDVLVQCRQVVCKLGQTHLGSVQAIVLTEGASMPLNLKHIASSITIYVQW